MSKRGRPTNYTVQDVILVIDQYIGIYGADHIITATEVATFAKNKLSMDKFKYYVITRCPEANQYLMDINNRIKAAHKAVNNDNIAFSSLDVSSLIELPKEKLAIFLQQLSTAWEEVCNTQKRTIKNNYDLQIKVKELKEREDCLAREYAALQQQFQDYRSKKDAENNRLKNQLRALEEALRIAWDGEAEKLLKQQGLFVSDSEEIDENKTITSPAFNFLSLISDPKEDDDLDGDKARCDFLRGLDKI